mmetsp:Transcript_7926/g.13798  ORF Transcript_7926/g.13798 Transcript_7926/m.13798 type:complete len:124 (+) Transcript_7926:587-958(+)
MIISYRIGPLTSDDGLWKDCCAQDSLMGSRNRAEYLMLIRQSIFHIRTRAYRQHAATIICGVGFLEAEALAYFLFGNGVYAHGKNLGSFKGVATIVRDCAYYEEEDGNVDCHDGMMSCAFIME